MYTVTDAKKCTIPLVVRLYGLELRVVLKLRSYSAGVGITAPCVAASTAASTPGPLLRPSLRSLLHAPLAQMASGSSGEVITIPRNFKLLEELEKAEKGNTEMTVSYGLVDSEDMSLSAWQCTILGAPGSSLENRIVSCLVHCSPNYPTAQPDVKFQSKLNFPFIVCAAKPNYRPLCVVPGSVAITLRPLGGCTGVHGAQPCALNGLPWPRAPDQARPRHHHQHPLRLAHWWTLSTTPSSPLPAPLTGASARPRVDAGRGRKV